MNTEHKKFSKLQITGIIIAALLIIVALYYSGEDDPRINMPAGEIGQINSGGQETTPVKIESLQGKKCLSGFNVKRDDSDKEEVDLNGLNLNYFESFGSGAFYGKIKNYKPEMNTELAGIIDQLMQKRNIKTYEHLEANVCLYNQDLYNPQGGATLNYVVEHLYCTNSCQTGVYNIRVDLDKSGTFVGYRQGNIYAK